MKFLDEVKIYISSGNGGPGCLSFRREANVPKGGPDGGDGGNGGNVILEASEQRHSLLDLNQNQQYKAQHGHPGQGRKKHGRDGKDLIIQVPCGTMVFDANNSLIIDLKHHHQQATVAIGGKGGKGNARFSSSTNRVPYHAQQGMEGDYIELTLDLRLLAHIGLIGAPNAGKSTLLNTLTNTQAKIGDYPFTTLIPNLGILKFLDMELRVADIPGLIEGASEGIGLGNLFLRHVSRTQLLVYMVTGTCPETVWAAYESLCLELSKSGFNIDSTPRLVVLSKSDLLTQDCIKKVISRFKKDQIDIMHISSESLEGISDLKEKIQQNYIKLASSLLKEDA